MPVIFLIEKCPSFFHKNSLKYSRWCGNIVTLSAVIAQLVERRIGSAEVTGPIPVNSLVYKKGIASGNSFFVYSRQN